MYSNLSISKKLLLPCLFAVMALVGCLTTFWALRYSEELHTAFESGIELTQDFSAAPLANAIWDFDTDLASVTLHGMEEFEPFAFAVVEADGKEFSRYTKADRNWNPVWEKGLKSLRSRSDEAGIIQQDGIEIVSFPLVHDGKKQVGTLYAGYSREKIVADIRQANMLAGGIGLIAFICFAGLLFAVARTVSAPINTLVGKIDQLQAGEVEIEIPYSDRKDEVGKLGRALEGFRHSIVEGRRLEAESKAAEQQRQADEAKRAEDRRRRQAEQEEAERRAAEEKAELEHQAELERLELEAKAQEAERKAEQQREDARRQAEADQQRRTEEEARQVEERMREQARVVDHLARGLAALSKGNLKERIHEALPGEYETLRQDFNAAVDGLSLALREVVQVSQGIDGQVASLSRVSQSLASDTERNAAAIEETAAALEEMTGTVREMATGAGEISDLARQARNDAEQSGTRVESLVEAMHNIENSSNEISKIIGIIDDIAFQTNLLALNAGVEAARAGEAGRGFAVVAAEVGVLAQRSSEAAKEISGLIGQGSTEVKTGSELVDQTRAALTNVLEAVRNISDQIESISVSSREQSSAVDEINNAVSSIDTSTQQTTQRFHEMNVATDTLNEESRTLMQAIERFTIADVPVAGRSSSAA